MVVVCDRLVLTTSGEAGIFLALCGPPRNFALTFIRNTGWINRQKYSRNERKLCKTSSHSGVRLKLAAGIPKNIARYNMRFIDVSNISTEKNGTNETDLFREGNNVLTVKKYEPLIPINISSMPDELSNCCFPWPDIPLYGNCLKSTTHRWLSARLQYIHC